MGKVILYCIGLEVILHFVYGNGINIRKCSFIYLLKQVDPKLWQKLPSGSEVGMVGYFTLHFMYLKFLIIWRMFRVFGLIDGVDSPENMPRCVNNNYTFTGFWRLMTCQLI